MPGIADRADLKGRKAAVIGGGLGIGRAISLALAQCGVDLAISDRAADELSETLAAAKACSVTAFARHFDALDVAALGRFYDEIATQFGSLDIVVNVVGGCDFGMAFDDTSPDDWAHDIHRNFGYVIHSTKAALPLIRKSGRGGSIINFTTIEAHRGAATISVYAGAKAATTNFSRALANELGHERIRINTIAPDMTPSRGNDESTHRAGGMAMGDTPPDMLAKSVTMAVPLGVPPSPDDLANAVLFLASDLSAGVTGTVLHVDGGTFASSGFLRWAPGLFSPLPPPQVAQVLVGND